MNPTAAPTTEVALSIRNLYKSYAGKTVHQGVSFELYKGEILGLFGGSGTGKSVILRSIIGLETPDSGEIIFKGENLVNYEERALFKIRTQIGYVFQNGALFDSMTVEENLAYPLEAHTKLTRAQIDDKITQILQMVDMPNARKLMPNELSGGMQKRAGLARAIILEPEIVLFDEPTAGLDPTNTKRLLGNILSFKKRGMTGIFVTHDIPSAFEVSDRIAILAEGKIQRIMTVKEMQNSNDPLVKSFTSGAHIA